MNSDTGMSVLSYGNMKLELLRIAEEQIIQTSLNATSGGFLCSVEGIDFPLWDEEPLQHLGIWNHFKLNNVTFESALFLFLLFSSVFATKSAGKEKVSSFSSIQYCVYK